MDLLESVVNGDEFEEFLRSMMTNSYPCSWLASSLSVVLHWPSIHFSSSSLYRDACVPFCAVSGLTGGENAMFQFSSIS